MKPLGLCHGHKPLQVAAGGGMDKEGCTNRKHLPDLRLMQL